MAAITDLASASAINSTDYFVVNQSGADRKAQANKLPLLDGANTFSAAQTFGDEINVRGHSASNLWSVDAAGSTTVTIGAGAVFQISADSTFTGFLIINETVGGGTACFLMGGGVVVEIADTLGNYSTAVGTATNTNVYWDGASQYLIKNTYGTSKTYRIFTIRMRSSS